MADYQVLLHSTLRFRPGVTLDAIERAVEDYLYDVCTMRLIDYPDDFRSYLWERYNLACDGDGIDTPITLTACAAGEMCKRTDDLHFLHQWVPLLEPGGCLTYLDEYGTQWAYRVNEDGVTYHTNPTQWLPSDADPGHLIPNYRKRRQR